MQQSIIFSLLYVVAFQISDKFCNVASFHLSIFKLLLKILACMHYL